MLIDFTPNKKLKLDLSTKVFMHEKTHTYLLVETKKNTETFLRLGNGCIELVKMGKESGARLELVPKTYDYKKAIRIYFASHLTRSSKVERMLREILGLPTSDIIEDEDGEIAVIGDDTSPKDVYTLSDMCSELVMEPGTARKLLRGRVTKPEFGWKWPNRDAANLVRAILTEHLL